MSVQRKEINQRGRNKKGSKKIYIHTQRNEDNGQRKRKPPESCPLRKREKECEIEWSGEQSHEINKQKMVSQAGEIKVRAREKWLTRKKNRNVRSPRRSTRTEDNKREHRDQQKYNKQRYEMARQVGEK